MRFSNKRHRLLFTWTLRSGVVCLIITAWALIGRGRDEAAVVPGESVTGLTSILTRELGQVTSAIRFADATAESGIAFRHFPDVRASLLAEDMGSGVACGDFDGDGRVDLFFVNFAGSILKPLPTDRPEARCRLYRNLGDMRFEDVTDRSGLTRVGFFLGAAWGDYDNDGNLDLYLTAYGGNVLYKNLGDGTFQDVTERAGVGDGRFGTGCSWGDYDRDGDLDLYVTNYVTFTFRPEDRENVKKQNGTEQPYTLNPSAYPPEPNALFRNNGDGTFTDVAALAGVDDPEGKGLSASWVDLDNDGWVDLYVANDVSNNGVFHNLRNGTFADVGASSLAADYRGAMGIATGDIDNDLDADLLITHWIAQENALFENMTSDAAAMKLDQPKRLWFLDTADGWGLGQVSLDYIGWATGFADFDNDGRRDLWLVNGSTFEQTDNHRKLKTQVPFLFWQRGDHDFIDVAAVASKRLAEPFVGRGGAHADLDQDGRLDLILLPHGGAAILLRNTSPSAGHWLNVDLRQTGGNTHALGARVYVTTGDTTQMAEVGGSSSYLSQDELTLHFGLGELSTVTSLKIRWPDGSEETHADVPADQTVIYRHEARYPVTGPTTPRP